MTRAVESLHLRPLGDDATCDAHEWPMDGLARRLVAAMRERHGKGGVNVCRECIGRAKTDAEAKDGRSR